MTMYELATVIRSKNAGPFTLTIDLIFASEADLDRAMSSPTLTHAGMAELYGVAPESVAIHELRPACAMKISLPRGIPSGSVGDQDVYGSQQHMPIAGISV
ncbi:MAG: DUF4387 domain-containing protein [Lentisphaerae bacterium]|jgi:hypothetical protein|nr:DUF4387 domain-containing protein [Lentisphaerota bacterium]MBT4814721.1 DUF4387 domain-containing protein [Lentisphaerota bacterium]MBT5605803.1 DUF4387 domain-containing protein [Lentisphaerota bacterium]MBT7055824.1 DUF4387 domain-containing protein [Lentisphaerota bacterium]MBT7847491.1 DUF4387 domain-containing protein [Lentisphaerota bacterium]